MRLRLNRVHKDLSLVAVSQEGDKKFTSSLRVKRLMWSSCSRLITTPPRVEMFWPTSTLGPKYQSTMYCSPSRGSSDTLQVKTTLPVTLLTASVTFGCSSNFGSPGDITWCNNICFIHLILSANTTNVMLK